MVNSQESKVQKSKANAETLRTQRSAETDVRKNCVGAAAWRLNLETNGAGGALAIERGGCSPIGGRSVQNGWFALAQASFYVL